MVHLTDVTLRDGLQMEARLVSVEQKLKLFELLKNCGYSRLEITSFVNPKWVPQFSDAAEFCSRLFQKDPGVECMAFVPNEKGLDRLLAYPIQWASAFIAATESFNKKNVNAGREETLEELAKILGKARAQKRKVRVYVSTVFGCPYEGKVELAALREFLEKVAALNPDEIALSDTIGVAVPDQVEGVLGDFLKFFPAEKTAMHFHNTYGLGLSAAQTAFQIGVRRFDGTTGGIGGCPYAKGATGNVPLDELMYQFYRQGEVPRFSADALLAAHRYLHEELGLALHSHLFQVMEKGAALFAV